MREGAYANYSTVGAQLANVVSSNGVSYQSNIFIPLYRQMALYYVLENATEHENIINDIKNKEPYQDIKAALDYYFEHYNINAERKFVLAGHSQGAAMLQVVIEEYFIEGGHKDYLKNLVCAYSVGYGVSKKWFYSLDLNYDGHTSIHLATGEFDTNCLLSWNTEGPDGGDGNFLLSNDEYDTYLINPLNWKTDETPATKEENLGVLYNGSISTDSANLFNATINLKRGSLVCSENNGAYVNLPPYGAIWGGKSLHTCDGSAFYQNMRINLGDRLDTING